MEHLTGGELLEEYELDSDGKAESHTGNAVVWLQVDHAILTNECRGEEIQEPLVTDDDGFLGVTAKLETSAYGCGCLGSIIAFSQLRPNLSAGWRTTPPVLSKCISAAV